MPFFSNKDNSNTSPEILLNDVISIFNDFFTIYLKNPNVFVENELEENIEFRISGSGLTEINQSIVDETINQLRDGLYYNFFTSFWEQKENLKLIDELNEKLQEIENFTNKQKQEMLILEKIKINDGYQKDIVISDSTKYLIFFNSLFTKIKKDITYFNLEIINNKKNLLVGFQKLKNEIKGEIQELENLNKKVDNKIKNIFKDNLYKETTMTSFILTFWAFRLKHGKKYELNLEQKEIKNCSNENFLVFFELINTIFVEYNKKLIKNEEKIFYDIFKKYNDNKKDLENEQKNENEIKAKIKQKLDEINEEIIANNKILTSVKKELEKNKNTSDNIHLKIMMSK